MAFPASDGSRFTNHSAMKTHESKLAARMPAKTAVAEPEGDEQGGGDVHSVVDQHGPAQEVHITHQDGKHSLHSTHGNGHTHQSEHGSAAEAYDSGKCLSGDCDCGGGM